MRQIKFRIFDTTTKEFITTYDNQEILIGLDGKLHSNSGVLNEKYFKLMQFTGLHDKNGKEIYEEDIIIGDVYGDLIKVEFNLEDCGFYPFSRPSYGGHEWENENSKKCEIIGNIHSNPELLESKQ